MPSEENGLGLQKVIQLVQGDVQNFKEYVVENDLNEKQLRKLLEAEEAGGNRKTVVNFLKTELGEDESHMEKEEVEVGTLKAVNHPGEDPSLVLDVNGVQLDFRENPSLDFAGHDFEVAHPHKDEPEHFENIRKAGKWLDQEETRKEGSKVEPVEPEEQEVKEKEDERKEKEEKEKLKKLLKDEYDVKDEKLEDKSLEELEELKDEMRKLETRREDVIDSFGLEEDDIKDKNLEELEELEDKLEKRRKKREELEERFEVEGSLSGRSLEELEDKEEELRKKKREKSKLIEKLEEYGYSREEVEDKQKEELEALIEEIKEKEKLLDQVGADLDKEELSEVTVDYLKKLKAQKEEREKLIEDLNQHGVSRDELESCTNEDLKNLLNDMESTVENYREILNGTVDEVKEKVKEMGNPDYSRLMELEEEGKDRVTLERFFEEKMEESADSFKKIEDEAENELEFLIGASEESEEEEEPEVTERVEELKEKFQDSLEKMKGSGKNTDSDRERVLALLDKYRDLDDRTQAIKIAQVMKAYIEREIGIERELTYGELSNRLEEYEDIPEIHKMRDFFTSIERQEYSGKIVSVDVDEVAKAAEKTVETLSRDVTQ